MWRMSDRQGEMRLWMDYRQQGFKSVERTEPGAIEAAAAHGFAGGGVG